MPKLSAGAPPGRAALAALGAAFLLLVAVTRAHAHAILMESRPAVQGTVAAGVVEVSLRYNSRIDAGRSRLLLLRADRSRVPLPVEPGASPDRLASRVELAPGEDVLRWQVLAVDGHITRGDVPFRVTGP